MIEGGEEIFESCNNEYWKAPPGGKEDEAEIVIDLKCPMRLETFSVINGFGDFGTKQFTLFGSRNISGPWTELYRGELPPGTEMTEEVYIFLAIISKLLLIFSRKFSAARRLMYLRPALLASMSLGLVTRSTSRTGQSGSSNFKLCPSMGKAVGSVICLLMDL